MLALEGASDAPPASGTRAGESAMPGKGSSSSPSAVVLPSPKASPSPLFSARSDTQVFAEPSQAFSKALQPLPVFKLKPPARLVTASEVSSTPLLANLEDIGAVSVLGTDLKVRVAHVGDSLELGDSFQTGEKGSARVVFEKGVQVLLPPGAILRLGEESVPGPAGGMDVPMVEVEQGEARILVEGAPKADSDGGEIRALKLLVRTRAGVIGVRGTDFIVVASPTQKDHAELRMIAGTVEVAADARALGMNRGIKVSASESIEFIARRPLPKPEHYEMGMMLKEFHDSHARMEELWNAAVRDAKTHRLQPQFLEMRTRKADAVNLQNGIPPAAVRMEAKRLEEEARVRKLREQGLQDESGRGSRNKHRRGRRRKKPEVLEQKAAEPADD